MKNNKLKLKFYINAKHAVIFGANDISSIHGHTWEVATTLIEKNTNLNQFHVLEKKIQDYLEKYKEEVINDIYPFTKINPTMENIGLVFFEDIEQLLMDSEYELESLEVLENPTRIYIVESSADYKHMENIEYERIMKNALNKARGINEAPIINAEDKNELANVLLQLNNSINSIKEVQEKQLKREKSRTIRKVITGTLFIIAVGTVTALQLLGYIDILSLF